MPKDGFFLYCLGGSWIIGTWPGTSHQTTTATSDPAVSHSDGVPDSSACFGSCGALLGFEGRLAQRPALLPFSRILWMKTVERQSRQSVFDDSLYWFV